MNDNSTAGILLCINCGFVGATTWANGIGPYCGTCANWAIGFGSMIPKRIDPDPNGDVARIIRAALPATASDDQVNEIARECWRAARGG